MLSFVTTKLYTQRSGASFCRRLNLSSIQIGSRIGDLSGRSRSSSNIRCHFSSDARNVEAVLVESSTANEKRIAEFFDASPSWSLKSLRAADAEYEPLTDQQIDHLAWLAHVHVEGKEREALKKDIASIVQFAKTFQHQQPRASIPSSSISSGAYDSNNNNNVISDSGLLTMNAAGETETRMRNDSCVEDNLADVLMPAAAESVYGMYVVPGTLASDEH